MVNLKKLLQDNQFRILGEITRELELIPTSGNENSTKSSVYTWVAEKGSMVYAIYLGKAGRVALKRFKEHVQGFQGPSNNGSISGEKKKEILLFLIELGYTIKVYERISAVITDEMLQTLGLKVNVPNEISMNASEEEILINAFGDFGFNDYLILNNRVDIDYTKSIIKAESS